MYRWNIWPLAAAYAFCVVVPSLLLLQPQSGTPFLYVLYPPWQTASQVRQSIAQSGASETVGGIGPFVARVAATDLDTVSRLRGHGALLVLRASPPLLCSRPRQAAS